MARRVHVVKRGSGWAVRRAGSKQVSSTHRTQKAAINAGRRTAKKAHTELTIHGRNGRIREGWSYGPDPHPPTG